MSKSKPNPKRAKKKAKVYLFPEPEDDVQRTMSFERGLSLKDLKAAVASLSSVDVQPVDVQPKGFLYIHPFLSHVKDYLDLLDSINSVNPVNPEPIDILKHSENNNVLDVLPETGILKPIKESTGGFDTDEITPMLDPDTGDDDVGRVGYDTLSPNQ